MMIHLSVDELRLLLAPVIPFAGTDDMLPVLTGIHLRTQGDYVVSEATDRFRLAVNRLAPEVAIQTSTGAVAPAWSCRTKTGDLEDGWTKAEVPAGLDVLLPVGQAKQILSLFRSPRNRQPRPIVTLEVTEDPLRQSQLTVSADRGLATETAKLSLTVDLLDGEFPKLNEMLAKAITDDGTYDGILGVNPKFLSAFQAAATAYKPVLGDQALALRFRGPTKPMLGFIGDDFVGLLMPRRRLDLESAKDIAADAQSRAAMASWLNG